MSRGDPGAPAVPAPADDAARAAAASRRLDDAFRTFLAERGAKRFPLSDVAGLVTGVAGLRLEADAVLDLWRGDDGQAGRRCGRRTPGDWIRLTASRAGTTVSRQP
jgi:hypothetical protein